MLNRKLSTAENNPAVPGEAGMALWPPEVLMIMCESSLSVTLFGDPPSPPVSSSLEAELLEGRNRPDPF